MNAEDCKVGCIVYSYDGPKYKYEVISLPDEDGGVLIKSCHSSNDESDVFHIDELHLYDEAKIQAEAAIMQMKVNKAKSAFEEAFAALREVQESNIYHLEDIGVDMKDLEKTIENNGWRTSSLWC